MSTDWPAYLAAFHHERPGITEDVLTRCTLRTGGGPNPYGWLVDGLAPGARTVDLGCGSAPTRPLVAGQWIGLDRSSDELARAVAAGAEPLVRGDIARLPLTDASADAVTCSMALMLVDPLDGALAEIRRILRPSGQLRVLLPTRAPLTWGDRGHYVRMFLAGRTTTSFPPSPLRRRPAEVLARHGFAVTADERTRFALVVSTPDQARRFVDSWYLPGVSAERRARAADRAARAVPFTIGVPLRRVVAERPPD